ncbi:MAG: hypothetical protein EXR79_14690 [Myxococcales bacterium]|nr:hypothetical protein [Myxococcales bacterium]
MPRQPALKTLCTILAAAAACLAQSCTSATPQGSAATAPGAVASDASAAADAAAAAEVNKVDTTSGSADADAPDAAIAPDGLFADAAADAQTAQDIGDAGAAADAKSDAPADAAIDAAQPAPIAFAALASAAASAICQANFKTCTPQDKMPYATQVGCVAAITAADAATFAKLGALVASGKLTYNGAAAAACLALAVEHCDELDFVDGPPICQTVFKGNAADGAACGFNVECASNYCFSKENCPGLCKKRVALGGKCGDDDKCVAGVVCFGGLCVADTPKDAGADCDPVKCKPGLYCSSKAKCAPLNKIDAPCDIVGACTAGLQCIDSGTGGLCKPMPKKGEPCTPDALSDASTQCAVGLVCFNDGGEIGTCEPKTATGGACVNSTQCGGWDVHCVGPTGKATCQQLSAKGGPCQPANVDIGEWSGCLDPWTCSGGVCIDVPSAGQKCADDLLKSCADDLMCDLVTPKCVPLPGAGEKCSGVCKAGFDCDAKVKPAICKPLVCN